MKPLALIPARGGSKRFPRKNVALLGGRPLVTWTIRSAIESGVFDDVYVSSDDEQTLAIAAEHGAVALQRPHVLAGDDATVVEVALATLDGLSGAGRAYDAVYVLLPSSPLRSSVSIRRAWDAFASADADALLSVIPCEVPPEWALRSRDGRLAPADPDGYERPRTALEAAVRHDGGHAIARAVALRRDRAFLGRSTIAFAPPMEETIDIDVPHDLAFAEFVLQEMEAAVGR